MGRLYTRWINPNKRKFRQNSSTIPVTGFSKVETFDTEGQFYDFIDEYVTDDGITFYISVAEPEEGSDLEYAYLLPYIADFIDAEPNYNIMWEPEYKDYKSAIGMGNRKRQAKQKILNTILAKGLPAAFGTGKSQTIESQQIDESEQSISEPESSTLGQKPSWLTVDSDAFNLVSIYRGTKERLEDKDISSFDFSFGTQAKGYKLSAFALENQITLLPILREYKVKGSEKILGDSVLKSISKSQYLFLPIWTKQPEAGKLTLDKIYLPMTLDQAEKYFLNTYKRWTKKTRARKAKFEPAKSSFSSNEFGLGLDTVQMSDFKLYLNQNDLVIDAVAATLNPDEIQQKATEKDKRFHRRLIRQLVKTGLYGTYVSLISGHKGSELFYPESIEDGLFLDEFPLNEFTNVLAIVGEFERLILDVIDFKYALIPPHSGVEFARFVRKRIKDFPDETKKNKTESSFNNYINQELIEELARKGAELVKQADESAEQADESTPVVTQKPVTASATQITNINQLDPDGDYRFWTYDPNFNSWGSGLYGKGSQFIKKWDKIVEFNEQKVEKKAIFHFNDDPREAKVEYAQMEPNLVENGEEIPVEKINWDTGKLKRIKRYSFDSYNPVYLYEGAEGQSFYITSVEWPQLGKFYYVVPPTENPIDYQFDYQTEGIMRAGTLKDLVKRIEKEGLSYKLYDPQAILHSDDFQYVENPFAAMWKTFLNYRNVIYFGDDNEEIFDSGNWEYAVKYGIEYEWNEWDGYKEKWKTKKAKFHPKTAESELDVVLAFEDWMGGSKPRPRIEHNTLEFIFGEGDYPTVQQIQDHFEQEESAQQTAPQAEIVEEKMEVQTETPVRETYGSWSLNNDDCSITFERIQVK